METKQAYKAKFEAQLEQAQAKLMALKASAKEKTADGAISASKQIEALEESVADARVKLAELGQAGEDKWADFKASVEGAWAKVTDSFKRDDASKKSPPEQ